MNTPHEGIPGLSRVIERLRGEPFAEGELVPGRVWTTLLNDVVELRPTGGGESLFAKLARSGEDLRAEYVRTQRLALCFAGAPSRWRSVEAVAFFDDLPALVVRGVPGEALLDVVGATCRFGRRGPLTNLLEAASAVGQWLQFLEGASAGVATPQAVWGELRAEASLARENLWKYGNPSRSVARLFDTCARTLNEGRAALPVTLAHRDFHPGNVFVTPAPERIVSAIDLRLSAPRFAGYDAVLLDFHLRVSFAPWRFDSRRIGLALAAFRAGFGRDLAQSSPAASAAAAEITLRGLVYFATLNEDVSWPRQLTRAMARARFARWARRWLAGGSGSARRTASREHPLRRHSPARRA
jgi:hypothetical protein